MLATVNSPITREEFDTLIDTVATKPEFRDCFAVRGCDLSLNHWWVAYVRQSLDEQARNNRLPEYLLTCAKIAKELGVLVPREYILYDHESSEHLERPQMVCLRKNLIAQRSIGGVIFTHQGRPSAEPLHQMIFEMECTHYGVKFFFGDAPTGSNFGSEAARLFLALGNKLRVRTNRDSNRAGNVGRVLKGWVPAGKPTYGYRYRKEVDPSSGATLRAWWETDQVDPEGKVLYGSEAWVVDRVFHWIGVENQSPYWVAKELNKLGIKPRYAEYWSPSLIVFLIRKHCYTGKHAYNTAHYVTNPERPLGDITGEVKRTIRKPKPEEEHVKFNVPPLVSETLWERSNQNLGARKGTREKKHVIAALFRGRVFCPKCGAIMTVRRYYEANKYPHFVYYACTGNCQSWKPGKCDMRAGRIDRVDNAVKYKLEMALMNPEWAIMQSARNTEEKESDGIRRQLRLLDIKISNAKSKIATIQDHIEMHSGIYTLSEAEKKITKNREIILEATKTKEEQETLLTQISQDTERSHRTKEAFRKIHDENIKRSTFADWLRIIEILDAKLYPSEDWSEIKISTAIDLARLESKNQSLCYNINIASVMLSL